MAMAAKIPAELMCKQGKQFLLRPVKDDQSEQTGLLGKGDLKETVAVKGLFQKVNVSFCFL